MTMLTYGELGNGRLLSSKLWKGLAPPRGGLQAFETQSGNPAIGFFDDFFKFSPTTGTDGYGIVDTGSGTVTQIPSDGVTASTGMGLCRLLTTEADNDEAMLFFGNALEAPFKLVSDDLVFECRMKLTDIETAAHSFYVGLANTGACVTVQCITAADDLYATADFLGYQQLHGETTAVDGVFQSSGKTKQDGAADFTGLDTLATIGATNFIKLGLRFNSGNGTVDWFVDGVEQTAGRLKVTAADTNEAASFPDGNYMTPIICLMNDGANAAANIELDWWACAQYA